VPPLYEVGANRHAACFLRDGATHANPVVKELT
jgi:hypothetical protein